MSLPVDLDIHATSLRGYTYFRVPSKLLNVMNDNEKEETPSVWSGLPHAGEQNETDNWERVMVSINGVADSSVIISGRAGEAVGKTSYLHAVISPHNSTPLDASARGPADVVEETTMSSEPGLPSLLLTAMCWAVVYFATLVVFWKLLCVLWHKWNLRCTSDPASGLSHLPLPPGDFGLPFVGETLLWLAQGGKFNSIRRQKYGNVFKTNVIGVPMVRVTGHELVKQILSSEHDKVTTIWPTAVRNIIGENALSNSTGADHSHKRKLTQKVFTRSALNSYIPMVREKCVQLLKELGQVDEPTIFASMQRLTVSTMCTLSGVNVKSSEEFDELYTTFRDLADNVMCIPLNIPFFAYNKALQARKKMLKLLHTHVQEKRQSLMEMSQTGNGPSTDELDAFSIMQLENLKYQERCQARANINNNNVDVKESLPKNGENDAPNTPMSDIAMKETILELFFAGYSTTASVITSTMLELSRHPEIFRNLEDELLRFGHMRESSSKDEEPFEELDLAKLHEMPYLDQVVKETLRCHPAILGAFRRARKTFQLGDYRVPKGWTMVYNIRDTHDYESGGLNEFNPDRFAKKTDNRENKFKYIPFGCGPRNCPGQEFARMVIKLVVVEMIRRFKGWELTGQNPPVMRAIPTLRPADGMPVKLFPRKRAGFV
uniref:Cytochrome P450 26B1 n=1 Tax=Phallusia mammillata TaxID=59560 RepID=A0A6F9D9M7_9ASCI|nr:cytochrome P450 26B1 [Phallusia mammillata]